MTVTEQELSSKMSQSAESFQTLIETVSDKLEEIGNMDETTEDDPVGEQKNIANEALNAIDTWEKGGGFSSQQGDGDEEDGSAGGD